MIAMLETGMTRRDALSVPYFLRIIKRMGVPEK